MTRTNRLKLLVQAIGADIKAILDKTNLLKTAAYRDVGTTAGKVAEFVGDNGIGGFGFGGRAVKMPDNQDMNALPLISAIWTGEKKGSTSYANMPAELSGYSYSYRFIIQTYVSADRYCISQVLTMTAYPPSGVAAHNTVIYIRTLDIGTWSAWQRITGKLKGVDVGGDVVGEDIEVNSIQAGITSPKIAFEVVTKPITYENFGYQPDGITQTGQYDNRGAASIKPNQPTKNILSTSIRVGHRSSYNTDRAVSPGYSYSGEYYEFLQNNSEIDIKTVRIRTEQHVLASDGNTAKSGQKIFDGQGYIQLFVIYKVD